MQQGVIKITKMKGVALNAEFARSQVHLALVTGVSFALAAITSGLVAGRFAFVELTALLQTRGGALLLGLHLLILAWMTRHFWRFLAPIRAWVKTHPGGGPLPPELDRHLGRFTGHYWSFFLLYVLSVPAAYHWLEMIDPRIGLPQLMLLHLVITVLIGMPAYLQGLSVLGRLATYTGVGRVPVRMSTKLLLIGGYIPLLTSSILLMYYSWRTGFLHAETLLIWAALGAAGFLISGLAVGSLRQGLAPVGRVIAGTGASTHERLSDQLRPQSQDEIGHLVQTLGRLLGRLGSRESHMHAVVEAAAEGIIVVDPEGGVETYNPAAEQLFGYSAQEMRQRPLAWLLPDLGTHSMRPGEIETEGLHRSGRRLPVSVRISPMQLDGQLMYTCLVADISERRRAEQRLSAAEARYRDLVETAHDLVWSMDPQGRWTFMNEAATLIYGYRPEEMLQRHFSEFQAPEAALRDRHAMGGVLEGKELLRYETVHLDRSGNRRHISFNAKALLDDSGRVVQISGTGRDITDQKAYERELTFQAQHDSLTGLYNRDYFQQELARVVARLEHARLESALFYLDLDQFKYINDTLGHAAGDRLLLDCTRLLAAQTREGDLLARFGGDEFTMLVYNTDEQAALALAKEVCKSFESVKFQENGTTYNVTCSIGVSMISQRTHTADEVLAHADLACHVAKARGRNRATLYNPLDRDEEGMAEDMGWAARVREALEHDRFELVYQPIVSVADRSVHSYEVLLRMRTVNGEVILPGGFLPAAERFGLIHEVDRWTVIHALESLDALQRSGCTTGFAINLSGRAFEDKSLLPLIASKIREYGIDAQALTFEITETAAIANLTAAVEFITRLKELGCQFALDDFGSGFSSFTYLKHLPVDKLKIDGAFVQGMAYASVDQAMVRSMNEIAHALGKQTVAEFVENEQTLRLLKQYGVDFAQGNYIGKPQAQVVPGAERMRG